MKRNQFIFIGIVSFALAFVLAPLLCGGWNGMMGGPSWPISPMGGTMNVGLGGIFVLLAGTVILVALVAWVRSGKKK